MCNNSFIFIQRNCTFHLLTGLSYKMVIREQNKIISLSKLKSLNDKIAKRLNINKILLKINTYSTSFANYIIIITQIAIL